jgi:shikimate dehydrogenase
MHQAPKWPSASTVVVGVIGNPIAHSLSPLLHQAAFEALGLDWVSLGFEVGPSALGDAVSGIRGLKIRGVSVTMPHKESVMALLDRISPLAKALGSVNCITNDSGVLEGDTTDGPGFIEALAHGADFDPMGKSCVVLGAGGAARAVAAALGVAGARDVAVVNRSPGPAARAAAIAGPAGRVGRASDALGADLVVQATSVGMAGTESAGRLVIEPELLGPGQLVVDLVYHPVTTALIDAANRRGARTMSGVGMLVHQAALAIERWTGLQAPLGAMWEAAAAAVGAG